MVISVADLLKHYGGENGSNPYDKNACDACRHLRDLKLAHLSTESLFSNLTLDTIAFLLGTYPPLSKNKFRFLLLRVEAYAAFLRSCDGLIDGNLKLLIDTLETFEGYLKQLYNGSKFSKTEQDLIVEIVAKNRSRVIDKSLELQPYEPSPGYRMMFLPSGLKTELLCWQFMHHLIHEAESSSLVIRSKNIFNELSNADYSFPQTTTLIQELARFPPEDTYESDLKLALT